MELAGKNFEHSHDARESKDLLQLTNSSHGPLQASAIQSPPRNAHNTIVPRDNSREVAQDTSPQKYHTIDTADNKDRNVLKVQMKYLKDTKIDKTLLNKEHAVGAASAQTKQ